MEKIIADTWKEVLNVAEVGIHDNFFDLGGNSLDIFTINSMLKKALNIDIPMVKMFKFPTVHSLARYLNHGERDENSPGKEMKRSAEIARGRKSLKEMNRRRGKF
jgi:acyl carrier protein